MRLRNKKTGEIPDKIETIAYIRWSGKIMMVYRKSNGERIIKYYDSLEELHKEWEDAPEESKVIIKVEKNMDPTYLHIKCLTEEEAEEAVRKFKAWERLKDAGLKIDGWDGYVHTSDGMGSGDHFDCCGFINIHGKIQGTQGNYSDYRKDLDLLFPGGEG